MLCAIHSFSMKHKSSLFKRVRESLMVLIAGVLIWRGIWILLDLFDVLFLEGSHTLSAILSILIGGVLVYVADRNLEDLV